MSDWVLVPCLVELRTEFNAVAPGRDRGADGSVGDSRHSPSSDHSPDEDSPVLRDHDPDDKNEVHALDVDSSGPWPGGPAWFDAAVKGIVDRHRRGVDDRLQYVIWNRRIANRDVGNWRWRTYTGTADPHVDHAHFSARYTTAQEQDTSPWGLLEEDDMELTDKLQLTGLTQSALGIQPEGGEIEFGSYLGTLGVRIGQGQKAAQQAVNDVTMVRSDLRALAAKVDLLSGPAGPVDLDALAELVVQKLAGRLAS